MPRTFYYYYDRVAAYEWYNAAHALQALLQTSFNSYAFSYPSPVPGVLGLPADYKYLVGCGIAADDVTGKPNQFFGTDALLFRIICSPSACGSYDTIIGADFDPDTGEVTFFWGDTTIPPATENSIIEPYKAGNWPRWRLILLLDKGWYEEYLLVGEDYTQEFEEINQELGDVANVLREYGVEYGGLVDYREDPVSTLLEISIRHFGLTGKGSGGSQ